ncbi:hypothetical protein NON00_08500 [Roseomonas sp. GC11]|uniref:hypothetical protein n=1 Tax=Roseomonas sp. GC11 TaxID=2950546 RepID=UPI0021086855|nr:hypothetical protein [Roseomonas sp. GC11]MCQ4159969.1 hypothetical protein [Roseomonas sp. GC11]
MRRGLPALPGAPLAVPQGWLGRCLSAAPPWRRASDLVPAQSRRERALEQAMEALADRLARTEIALLREQRRTDRESARAEAAEAAVVRLQDALDRLRQTQREPFHPA